MSTFDADDRDTMGYFLPENGQLRLQKLRDYAEFLSHIAQPRTPDAAQEGIPEINAEQVAICLEFLVEQMDLVLSDLSFPAYRAERDTAPAADETPYAAEAMPDDIGERYRFGLTLDQVTHAADERPPRKLLEDRRRGSAGVHRRERDDPRGPRDPVGDGFHPFHFIHGRAALAVRLDEDHPRGRITRALDSQLLRAVGGRYRRDLRQPRVAAKRRVPEMDVRVSEPVPHGQSV